MMIKSLLVEQIAKHVTRVTSGSIKCYRLPAQSANGTRNVDSTATWLISWSFAPKLSLWNNMGYA
jgi:hypothetical protein